MFGQHPGDMLHDLLPGAVDSITVRDFVGITSRERSKNFPDARVDAGASFLPLDRAENIPVVLTKGADGNDRNAIAMPERRLLSTVFPAEACEHVPQGKLPGRHFAPEWPRSAHGFKIRCALHNFQCAP